MANSPAVHDAEEGIISGTTGIKAVIVSNVGSTFTEFTGTWFDGLHRKSQVVDGKFPIKYQIRFTSIRKQPWVGDTKSFHPCDRIQER